MTVSFESLSELSTKPEVVVAGVKVANLLHAVNDGVVIQDTLILIAPVEPLWGSQGLNQFARAILPVADTVEEAEYDHDWGYLKSARHTFRETIGTLSVSGSLLRTRDGEARSHDFSHGIRNNVELNYDGPAFRDNQVRVYPSALMARHAYTNKGEIEAFTLAMNDAGLAPFDVARRV